MCPAQLLRVSGFPRVGQGGPGRAQETQLQAAGGGRLRPEEESDRGPLPAVEKNGGDGFGGDRRGVERGRRQAPGRQGRRLNPEQGQ